MVSLILTAAVIIGLLYYRQKTTLVTAYFWLLYFIYECYMRFVWEPEVIAPIRVDLLFIYPLLLIATVVAIWKSVR